MEDPEQYRLYRLCPCGDCNATGRTIELGAFASAMDAKMKRCKTCRGEGRALFLVATCGTPEAVGVALVTLGREGEWQDCQLGVLDSAGLKNEKWLVVPWQASARNVRDAARTLAHARHQQ
jgi:hypothetical protein